MDRRQLLQRGAAALAFTATTKVVQAQSPPRAAGFALSAYSRNLQWLRTPQDLAKGVIDLGLSRVNLTVSRDNGHVDPQSVARDLPEFVQRLKHGGVAVTCITTDINDATSPDAQAILRAASASGIPHYVWGGLRYDESTPYRAQMNTLKSRLQRLVRLNQRHGIKGLYHPARGVANVGSTFFDILELMRDFDPRHIGIQYDTAALLQATPETTVAQLRAGREYIGGVAINDAVVTLELPRWNQGPYTGSTTQLVDAYFGGDYTGRRDGDPLALGGGGRPLPFRFRPVRVGTGMIDLTLLGKTLKEINFDGPAETQVEWELAGAEKGAASITAARLNVLGQIKRDRLIVEQAFADTWDIDIARPPYLQRARGNRVAGGQVAADPPGPPD